MQTTATSGDLARVAVAEIGPDVVQVRLAHSSDEDRRFLTGIEVALIVGTLVVRAFWKGFATGSRKALEERGEDWGMRAVNAMFDRAQAMLGLDDGPEKELPQRAKQAQTELDLIVVGLTGPLTAEQFAQLLAQSASDQVGEIARALGELGFDAESAQSRAERLVEQLAEATAE